MPILVEDMITSNDIHISLTWQTINKVVGGTDFLSVGKIRRENEIVYELAAIINQEVKSSSSVLVYLFLDYTIKKREKKQNTYKFLA